VARKKRSAAKDKIATAKPQLRRAGGEAELQRQPQPQPKRDSASGPASHEQRAGAWNDWARALLLVALVFGAYWPAVQGGWVWDDDDYVTRNSTLRSLAGLWDIWFRPGATPQYYPLVHTTFWLEYRLWGLWAPGFHFTNVALHALSALLLWRTFLTLNLPGAFWAAALWALHPVAVESVAWVTERKNTLSGLFFLAASYVALRSGAAGSAWQGSRYAASLVLYVLALLSKTVTATWPISLALVWWAGSRSLGRERLVRLLPALMIGAALASVTVLMERHHVGAVGADWNLTFLQRLLIASRALWFYLGKLLWPFDLTFIYPRWEVPAPAPSDFVWLAACAFAAAVLAAAVRWVGRWPLAAALYFAVSLGPALGFVNVFPMRYSFVADHYQYLASIGPLSLLVCGSAALWQALRWRGGAAPVALRRAARAAAPALALSLAALTWSQAHIYRDVEALWHDTLRKNPRAWMAHNNLGLLLLERNELRAAEQHFEQALAVKTDDSFAMNNLGLVYARRGELQRAAEWFARAVQIDPTQAEAANNLGNVFAQTGQ